jgi:hypothetical protein
VSGTPRASGARADELLRLAADLLRRADPVTAGLWPRAAALLALRALEAAIERLWAGHALDLRGCSMRTQLICLRGYLDAPSAARASHAWAALDRACHHHPYELAPTAAELDALFTVVAGFAEPIEAERR